MNINLPSSLSDTQLINEVKRLSGCEREATACLIAHLAEFDARELHRGAGFPSLFNYCTEVLRLSEHEAYNRIEVARTVRRFPRVLDMVAAGSLNLTTVRLLAPHLTKKNAAAEVIDRALSALLEALARKKFAATQKPRPNGAHGARGGSRHVPAGVKRAVWLRDGGRCAFVGEGRRRCAERGFLEFHHVRPHAVGGPPTVENIEVRCRAHNAYEAELYYGPGVRIGGQRMDREDGNGDPGGRTGQLVPERVGSIRSEPMARPDPAGGPRPAR
jgi:hypothetical protein